MLPGHSNSMYSQAVAVLPSGWPSKSADMACLKFMIPERGNKPLPKPGRVPEAATKCHRYSPNPRGSSCRQAVSRHRLLPTPSWKLMQTVSSWRRRTRGQFLWESVQSASNSSNIQQVFTAAGTPCTSQLMDIDYLSLCSLIEEVNPNNPCHPLPFIW